METLNLVEDVLKRRTWLLKENSNTQVSPSAIDLYISSQGKEEYALKKLYSKDVVRSHIQGSIYIHTLHSIFKPYCTGIDARVFLLDGLRFPHCRSAPPKHFNSAVYQSMAYIFYSQLFFSGAQAIDYYNWFLAPFLHYDKLNYKEVKQILQGFVFQLNQSNRTGAQSAFSNIGMRIKCPPYLENEPIIFKGKKQRERYGEFEESARMIYKGMMEVIGEGDGGAAPFTFPILTTGITKELDWNDELVEKTMECVVRMGSPYFLNLTSNYLDEKYVHAMCCRLLVEHSGGVWQAGGLGTGSNKVVTINLPHIALLAKNESNFFSILNREMEVAKKALLESNRIIKNSIEKWNLLQWLKMKTRDGAPYYNFKERRLTFGVIGLNECLLNLINEPITSKEGLKFGLKIIKYMNERIGEFCREDGVVYNLEQTPAESATYKLAYKDRVKFGRKAHIQGRGKEVYYSNSSHVPYKEDISIIEKIKIEEEFHPYFTGGAICHIWIGESKPNISSLKEFVKRLSKTKLAYYVFSPDYSICKNEHIQRGMKKKCIRCGGKVIDYINRVVGYFTRVSHWNPGKRREYKERRRFKMI